MSLVSTILTRVGYRLQYGLTIGTSTEPSTAECIAWMNETALWLTGLCAENNSDLGRTIGSISTSHTAITAASKASPCSITAASHGLMGAAGTAEVLVYGAGGMTEINNKEFTATYSSANAVTLGVDSSAYTTYTSGGYVTKRKYSDLATTLYCPAHMMDSEGNDYSGWIVDSYGRSPLKLISEGNITEYNPVEYTKPDTFYVDGSNNVCFPSYLDADYTVKIVYYTLPTALTATTETVPFLGLFDNVFIEALTWRAQNRDEYDTTFELKWQSFLTERALRTIHMRKQMTSRVE